MVADMCLDQERQRRIRRLAREKRDWLRSEEGQKTQARIMREADELQEQLNQERQGRDYCAPTVVCPKVR